MDFKEWWYRMGLSGSSETLAEVAWNAAKAQSGNYTVDDPINPRAVTFANGRTVRVGPHRILMIGWY